MNSLNDIIKIGDVFVDNILRLTLKENISINSEKHTFLEKGIYFINDDNILIWDSSIPNDNISKIKDDSSILFKFKFLNYIGAGEEKRNFRLPNLMECILLYNEQLITEEIKAEIREYLREYVSPTNDKQKNGILALAPMAVTKYVIPNNKVNNHLSSGKLYNEQIQVIVSNVKAKKEVITKVMLSYDDIKLVGRQEFTAYDRVVHNAVVSLYAAGNETFTPPMVYRAMTGKTETEKISPQAVGAVTKSLEKSRSTRLYIDFTEEAQLYKQNVEKATYDGYLLATDRVIVKTGGQTVEAYKLLRKPILYEYAQVSGQVLNIPIKLLQTEEAVRNTDEVIVIKEYLIRQIEWLKRPKNSRNTNITYKCIVDELKLTELQGKALTDKMIRLRSHVKALLEEWKKQKYIKDFTEYKEGKTAKGVTINT